MTPLLPVLIIGHQGFIGSALGAYLTQLGVAWVGFSRVATRPGDWSGRAHIASELWPALAHLKPALIFLLTGAIATSQTTLLEEAHSQSSQTLLQGVAQFCPLARVIVLGSAAEYGFPTEPTGVIAETAPAEPTTPYGRSKLAQYKLTRHLAQTHHLNVLYLRLFNTLGIGQSSKLVGGAMVARLAEARQHKQAHFSVFNPLSQRDFLDVRDVARLLWLVAHKIPLLPHIPPIQLASGQGVSILQLTQWLYEAAGLTQAQLPWQLVTTEPPHQFIGQPHTLHTYLKQEANPFYTVPETLVEMWRTYLEQHIISFE